MNIVPFIGLVILSAGIGFNEASLPAAAICFGTGLIVLGGIAAFYDYLDYLD